MSSDLAQVNIGMNKAAQQFPSKSERKKCRSIKMPMTDKSKSRQTLVHSNSGNNTLDMIESNINRILANHHAGIPVQSKVSASSDCSSTAPTSRTRTKNTLHRHTEIIGDRSLLFAPDATMSLDPRRQSQRNSPTSTHHQHILQMPFENSFSTLFGQPND